MAEDATWSLCLMHWFHLPEKTQDILRDAAAAERKYWSGQQKTKDHKEFLDWLELALAGWGRSRPQSHQTEAGCPTGSALGQQAPG